ncbi:MAG TPA: PIG-L family deacetylase, partial [Actinomycetota bacterium]|nr:PIG-L family deacetylase [Actinomycetota bacterium]
MFDVSELGAILAVWAHPDDDIFQTAGLMAAAADNGQRVVDVTATRGEGGSMDEERWPPEQMGEVRTGELLRSLEVLGVKEHHFLE